MTILMNVSQRMLQALIIKTRIMINIFCVAFQGTILATIEAESIIISSFS
jgi:hypothetical protein